MSSLFLFGAGASFGSGPCHPNPPPLGNDLFPALRALGGVAASVSPDLSELFTRNFEAGMERFWQESNTRTTEFLRDMARFFALFEPMDGNCYIELMKILGGNRKKAVMVTTNYDLLIEHAICASELMVTYGGLPVEASNVPVIKIHGSCNFLPALAPRQLSGVSFSLGGASNSSILETGVRPAKPQEVIDFCNSEDSIAPALAMYSPSKQVLFCKGFIRSQQEAWRESIARASRAYVIGLRVHPIDEHIWQPLAQASCPVYYVGFEPNEFLKWAKENRRARSYILAQSFQDALPKIAVHHRYRGKFRSSR